MTLTDWSWVEPNATILAQWERCKPWIEAALEHDGGHYELDDVLHEIIAGRAALWPGQRSAVVTQFWYFPKAKVCNHWLAGGDLTELVEEMQPVIDDWARSQGCTEMIVAGRKGWERALSRFGFKPVWVALRKFL